MRMDGDLYPNSENLNARSEFPLLVLEVKDDVPTPPNPGFGIMHWHHDLQVIYVRTGRIELATLEGRLQVSAGEAVVVNTGVVHRIVREAGAAYASLIFPLTLLANQVDGPIRRAIARIAGNAGAPIIALAQRSAWHDEAIGCVLRALSAWQNGADATDELAAYHAFVALHELFLLLVEHIEASDPKPATVTNERMRAFLPFIAERYAEPISLADIAGAADVSESECLRCFRESLQTTPYRYLLDYRLERAAELLENGNETVAGIAAATGFNQPSHFAKLFRERTGLSPRAYRKAHRDA